MRSGVIYIIPLWSSAWRDSNLNMLLTSHR